MRAESHDNGQTWTRGIDTQYHNPNAAVDLVKLKSGNLLMAYNHHMSERDPLRLALSTDGGKTFTLHTGSELNDVMIKKANGLQKHPRDPDRVGKISNPSLSYMPYIMSREIMTTGNCK